ncbi:type I-E CRISPR-associated protein Cse2/CasB [Nocardiopsis alba]|uniref:type I-E CRISPR-associated protein Cse2/CasB n=1 Tax=Nocardiopsis alba TaxID=53437 RepID=UPI001930C0B5|nr:type I-E CRISPR-associated protein Cse2/CasB [Nocardiopsis alba]
MEDELEVAEAIPARENVVVPRWDPRFHPFCPVRASDGRVVLVSLLELLRMADPEGGSVGPSGGGYAVALSSSTPGESIAILEFILAICYASGFRPESELQWKKWVRGAEPLGRVADWLEAEPDDEWDLFNPDFPLGQNSLLSPYIDQHGAGPALLVIEHSGNYNQFFDHHHLDHPEPLPADAAFRAMLAQHAYGPGGRARIPGKSTLGPTLTNLSVGRLVGRVRVIALGNSLGDTLRLNMAPLDTTVEPLADDTAESGDTVGSALSVATHLNLTWEQENSPEPRRRFDRKPPPRRVYDLADLYTSLGRSILLRPTRTSEGVPVLTEDGSPTVDRVLVAAGEILDVRSPALMQDAAYITTSQGERKPLWPSLSRALWREAHALYASSADRGRGADLYGRLSGLPARPLRLWAVGLVTNQSSALTWVEDDFPLYPGREVQLRHAATQGSVIAEYVARSLGRAAHAAWKVVYPNPKPSDKKQQIARFDAQPEHWAGTAEPFHLLLEEAVRYEPPHEPVEAVHAYAATLVESAEDLLGQRLGSLPYNLQGFQARNRASRALTHHLCSDRAPEELREVARMTFVQRSEDVSVSEESRRLAGWLAGLVHSRDYGRLADLRRSNLKTNTHIEAGWFSGPRSRDEEQDQARQIVFRQVAFLYALYHRGESRPHYGKGSLGTALHRVGDSAGHGPDNPGARRLMDRIVMSRRLPQRHLQHAIDRLRSCEKRPPEWAGLADDLLLWNDRKAKVAERWAVDFLEPPSSAPKRSKNTTPETTTTKREEA